MELEDLVQEFARSRFHRLEVGTGSQKVVLRRSGVSRAAGSAPLKETLEVTPDAPVLVAPRVGVFTPRVAVGDRIEAGSSFGSIRAMNIQHEIKAQKSGVVKAVLVAAGDGVQFGDVLIELEDSLA